MQECEEGFAGMKDDCVLIQLGSLHLKELSKVRTAGDSCLLLGRHPAGGVRSSKAVGCC